MSAATTTSTGAALIEPGRAPVDVGEQLGREPGHRVLAPVLLPRPLHEVADPRRAAPGRARRRTPTAGGSPRSARRSRRRAPGRSASSETGVVGERRGTPVARATTAKKSGSVLTRCRSPSRRKLLTYMIRSSGWRAQWSNAGAPGSPSTFIDERRHRLERQPRDRRCPSRRSAGTAGRRRRRARTA